MPLKNSDMEKILHPYNKPREKQEMREFESGAIRDTDEGKLNYVKGLSWEVLHYYLGYLSKHRTLSDGGKRDWDNWKKGIDQETYHDSLVRHTADLTRLIEGVIVTDNRGPVNEKDTLCAIMFNSMGKLFEILKSENRDEKTIS